MTSIRELRIGFVGCGSHACATLYPAIKFSGARIFSVATRSTATARAAAKLSNAKHYHSDYRSMLSADKLDAVFICVAPDDQAALTEQCLLAGVPVFVEKPLGLSVQESLRIAELSESTGIPVMVGFMKRFAPAYRSLANLTMEKMALGRIMVVDAEFSFAVWSKELRDDSYLILGAIHMVDLLRSLFGEVAEVQGFSSSAGPDIGMVFSLRFVGGHVANLTLCGVPAWARENERITVTGTDGWARVDNLSEIRYHVVGTNEVKEERSQILAQQSELATLSDSPMSDEIHDLYRRGFVGEVNHFLQQVSDNAIPSSSARENVATMELCARLIAAISA